MKRYRDKTGFDPAEPPGKMSVQRALTLLFAYLCGQESMRREMGAAVERMPWYKRPPGT